MLLLLTLLGIGALVTMLLVLAVLDASNQVQKRNRKGEVGRHETGV